MPFKNYRIQQILQMLQLKIGKDGRQIKEQKVKINIKSTWSMLSEVQGGSRQTSSSFEHQRPQDRLNENLPFSVLKDFGNAEKHHHFKGCFEVKAIQIKKIEEILMQLKRSVNAYRYLETDEVKAKQSIYAWFHEAEIIFLSALSGNCNYSEAQTMMEVQSDMIKVKPMITSRQIPKLHPPFSSLPNVHQQEAQALRAELQTFQRDSMEEMKKLQEISLLFSTLKDKYKAQKKANQTLNEAMWLYINECDTILERITSKYQKQQAVTVLEREVQQVLTKLKFKTFNYHYRS